MGHLSDDIHTCFICAACVLIELRQLKNKLLCFHRCNVPFQRWYYSVAYGVVSVNVGALCLAYLGVLCARIEMC